jgi:hypothetical protein
LLTRGFGVAGAAIARCRCFIQRWAATTLRKDWLCGGS